jgi:hypothetical protein
VAEDVGARACAEAINEACVGEIDGAPFFDEPAAAQIIREHTARGVAAALAEQAGTIERLKTALAVYADQANWGQQMDMGSGRLEGAYDWFTRSLDDGKDGFALAGAALGEEVRGG